MRKGSLGTLEEMLKKKRCVREKEKGIKKEEEGRSCKLVLREEGWEK